MKFIFDLDGTISRVETLPIMAAHFGIQDQIDSLTVETIRGNVPFIESFIRRVGILGAFPATEIRNVIADVPLFEGIIEFIRMNSDDCVVATGNLRPWIEDLAQRIGCRVCCSEAILRDDRVVKIASILRKEEIVREWREAGETVVFIGDGNNDAEAMRFADVAIATGLVHWPARSVLDVADFAVFSEPALLRLLSQLRTADRIPGSNTLVLGCAGLGSRLGLNSTKALINFEGRPLVQWQLEALREIEDVRIVVGFQANDVIRSAIEVRRDVVFVFNHDYFSTGPGRSLYLGSRYANDYVIAWDGDLLVHRDSLPECLRHEGEYLGVSRAVTEDAVFALLDEVGESVVGFSRDQRAPFEWCGPARLRKSSVADGRGSIYEGLLDRLPISALKVDAFDIDTVSDYNHAQDNFHSYIRGS